LRNVTFTGNSAYVNGGAIRGAGGPTASVTLNNVTVANNFADNDFDGGGNGGGVVVEGNSVFKVQNSIIAGNTDKSGQAPDCYADGGGIGQLTRRGYELIGNETNCTFGGSGDTTTGYLTGVNPLLGPLTTTTSSAGVMKLGTGSPAIDAGNPATPGAEPACAPLDQRGISRPQNVRCDLGAVEMQASYSGVTGCGPSVTTVTFFVQPRSCAAPPQPPGKAVKCKKPRKKGKKSTAAVAKKKKKKCGKKRPKKKKK
jgi:predicted outer membrane repeat protein